MIAYIDTDAPTEEKDMWKSVKKNITNMSDVEVRVVMTTKWRGQKVSFPVKRLYSIDFSKWSKTIEVYWATEEKRDNDTAYKGKVYDLERPERICEYQIRADGLYKIEEGLEHQEITPKKEGNVKRERDFLNPKEDTFQFENTGPDPLCVISGRKRNFDVSPPISPGKKLRIKIKRGFEFGLIPASTSSKGAGSSNEREYHATMFNFEAYRDTVTMFNVFGSTGGFEASAICTDGNNVTLENPRSKHYRESDRISPMYIVGRVMQFAGTAFAITTFVDRFAQLL